MATEAQQKMLWSIAKSQKLTLPAWGATAHLTAVEVGQVKSRLESGEDVFAVWEVPPPVDAAPLVEFERADIALLREILRELRAIRQAIITRSGDF